MKKALKEEITEWLPIPVANLKGGRSVPRTIIEAQLARAVQYLIIILEEDPLPTLRELEFRNQARFYKGLALIFGFTLLITMIGMVL